MGAESKIEWTHHTFNPWWGCVKVSPGCAHCYADTFAKRAGQKVWGVDAPRRFFGDKHWNEPLKWDREAEKAGVRRRVFCASMADVFEDRPDLVAPRARLFDVIAQTGFLDWLLLTKRPENIARLWPSGNRGPCGDAIIRERIWLGTTVEDQARAAERIPHLLAVPAAVRFLSVEPLLGPVDLSLWLPTLEVERETRTPDESFVDWVIVGGESGPGARPCDVAWIRSVVRQCREARVPVFVKQVGALPVGPSDCGRCGGRGLLGEVDGPDNDALPRLRCRGCAGTGREAPDLNDRKGGDPAEWPEILRVREFPEVERA